MKRFKEYLKSFIRDESGFELVELAIIVGIAAVIMVVVVPKITSMGQKAQNAAVNADQQFDIIDDAINAANPDS